MEFMIGCNYWASHAGIEMWANWDLQQVEKDFILLKENKVNTLRIFVNWRDFQPVQALYGPMNSVKGYVMKDLSEPSNPYYLDEKMLEHFSEFCDLSEKYGFKLIVGIITGWMSGRMFAPPALEGRNTFTDPVSLRFQIKLVTGIVKQFKNKKAIYAWNLGNECNCMSPCLNREEAFNWCSLIANTIRANDSTRPVISGMHGLVTEETENNHWLISDQGETTDMLTTHPYAYFVPHCLMDPMNSIRTLMHGATETRLYSDISNKPCLVEELGTLSNSICSDDVSAQFMNANLFLNWAYNSPGVLWWCAHEQSHLSTPPYNWNMLERELGLLDKDFKPKKYFLKMKDFAMWLEKTGLKQSKPLTDSAILLTKNSDHWGLGYMSFILLKQAGLEPEFVAPNSVIPEKKAYIMPSCHGQGSLYKKYYEQLKQRVFDGATLYVSNADGFFTEYNEFFGFKITSIELKSDIKGSFKVGEAEIPYSYGQRRLIEPTSAKVLAKDTYGNPLLLENKYGAGKVVFFNCPIEEQMLDISYAFNEKRHMLYKEIFKDIIDNKKVVALNDFAIVIENKTAITVVNVSDKEIDPQIKFNGVKPNTVYYGSLEKIPPCEAVVFSIK
ncbi:MAG: hypothetical protein E7365_03090 [Clostridiales bacterium]|nr:hypothetical protein [Clostridiales bacterium]